ncbi:hypothetical protein AZI98_12850 [Aeribacillus pallidus]|jgi:hypothetical protein|uniref:Uncharacterized protein n=1 Tax=Aeribacillus pallidus TaxID=33936 RepID=A0A165X5L0_9BACI|nr:hypothetical protein [Aeribacillus pallidus]KZN95659.1 hypothetical protein AZI98_12850 [Aeribacillus pallidus]
MKNFCVEKIEFINNEEFKVIVKLIHKGEEKYFVKNFGKDYMERSISELEQIMKGIVFDCILDGVCKL